MASDEQSHDGALGAMQVGKRASGKVSILLEYHVEDIEMPVDGNFGEQADFDLLARDAYDDYTEKDVVHAEIDEEEPVYEDDYDSEEDWPSYV